MSEQVRVADTASIHSRSHVVYIAGIPIVQYGNPTRGADMPSWRSVASWRFTKGWTWRERTAAEGWSRVCCTMELTSCFLHLYFSGDIPERGDVWVKLQCVLGLMRTAPAYQTVAVYASDSQQK